MSDNLDELGKKYGTDKSSNDHDFCRQYESHLAHRRSHSLRLLEIGILNGASIRMWREYFLNAEIHGIDINKCDPIDGVTQHVINAGDRSAIAAFATQGN